MSSNLIDKIKMNSSKIHKACEEWRLVVGNRRHPTWRNVEVASTSSIVCLSSSCYSIF